MVDSSESTVIDCVVVKNKKKKSSFVVEIAVACVFR